MSVFESLLEVGNTGKINPYTTSGNPQLPFKRAGAVAPGTLGRAAIPQAGVKGWSNSEQQLQATPTGWKNAPQDNRLSQGNKLSINNTPANQPNSNYQNSNQPPNQAQLINNLSTEDDNFQQWISALSQLPPDPQKINAALSAISGNKNIQPDQKQSIML